MKEATASPTAPGFAEFVTLIASLMALTALTIDAMIPALPVIGSELGVADDNDRQLVIGAMLIGFGLAQVIHGPLSDRFGRRPILVAGLTIYVSGSIVAALSGSFELLLFARFMQGVAVAATRVLAVAIVRDLYVGRRMAQVMSMVMMVFMVVPVVAPLMGQVVIALADWRWIFWVFAIIGLALALWAMIRLPETLPPGRRRALSVSRLAQGWRITLTDRKSLGYTLAGGMLSGALFGFITSIQQVVYDTFEQPNMLVPVFAVVAGTMAAASLTNSRIVLRLGTRMVSHNALIVFILFAAAASLAAYLGNQSIWLFIALLAGSMGAFGLTGANFSAMAMEEMGEVVGTASSVQGAMTITMGALLGSAIGQFYNGSTLPLTLGFLVYGSIALLIVLVTERGRLFREDMAPAQEAAR